MTSSFGRSAATSRFRSPDTATLRAFETPSGGRPYDETDVSVRAYVTRIPEAKLREYDPAWPDGRVIDWDENFRDDGSLMLVCCERDVDVGEFRRVLEEFVEYRSRQPLR